MREAGAVCGDGGLARASTTANRFPERTCTRSFDHHGSQISLGNDTLNSFACSCIFDVFPFHTCPMQFF